MQFHMMTLLDVLGKIAWIREDFLSQGKSQISLSGVQERIICHAIFMLSVKEYCYYDEVKAGLVLP